jgi:RNase P subunit RPR2
MPKLTHRDHCRTCNKKLVYGVDPERRQNNVDGIVWRFLGECKQCASDRVVRGKWGKRTMAEIKKEVKKHEHNIEVLRSVVDGKLPGNKSLF